MVSEREIEAIARIIDPASMTLTPEHYGLTDQGSFERTMGYGGQLVAREKARKIAALLAADAAPRGEPAAWRPTHRHKKRGSEYMLLGIGKMQTSYWHDFLGGLPECAELADMREVTIYRGKDGQLWVRPREEFEDGRFEPLPSTPTGDLT